MQGRANLLQMLSFGPVSLFKLTAEIFFSCSGGSMEVLFLACRAKGLLLGILARLNLRFPLESLFWFVALPEYGDNLETELLTTFVVGNFGHRHEFRDFLQTARHRASRRL